MAYISVSYRKDLVRNEKKTVWCLKVCTGARRRMLLVRKIRLISLRLLVK